MLKKTINILLLNNGKLLWLLKIAITGVFVYLVNKSLSSPLIQLANVRISWPVMSIVFLLAVFGLWLQVLRWRLICRTRAIPITMVWALKTMLLGNLLAFVTPGKLGELFRGVSLPQVKKSDTVIAVCVEKVYDALACVVFGLTAAALHAMQSGISTGQIVIGAGALTLAAAAVILSFLLRNRRVISLLRKKNLEKAVAWIAESFTNTSKSRITLITAYSFGVHFILVCQTALLFYMAGSAGFFGGVLSAAEAYAFMMLFPVFIANMGIREYSFALYLTGTSGLRTGTAVPVAALFSSLSILFVNMILPAVAGLLWWFFDTTSGAKKRESPAA
jgi:hypothetical protein